MCSRRKFRNWSKERVARFLGHIYCARENASWKLGPSSRTRLAREHNFSNVREGKGEGASEPGEVCSPLRPSGFGCSRTFPPQLGCDIDVVIRFESSLFDKPESVGICKLSNRFRIERKRRCFAGFIISRGENSEETNLGATLFSTAIFAIPPHYLFADIGENNDRLFFRR